jgi:hypothetical protein
MTTLLPQSSLPPVYARLVRRQLEHKLASTDTREPYAVCLDDSEVLCGAELKRRLKGAILLNLGAGCRQDTLDSVERFARLYGVCKVIHVDYRSSSSAGHTTRGLVVTQVKKDMLAYLAKQPSRSMSVTINDIDDCVIEEEAYARAVGEEISRVVPVGGLAFGHCAWPLRYIKGFSPIREITGKEGMPAGYYLKTTVTGNTGVIPARRARKGTGPVMPDTSSQSPPG